MNTYYITDQHPGRLKQWALCADGAIVLPCLDRERAVAALVQADTEHWGTIVAATEDLTGWKAAPAIAFVDTPSSDRRQLESGGGSFRNFPMPLMAQVQTAWGHDGAMIVGRIDQAEISGKNVTASGVIDGGQFGAEVTRLIGNDMLTGISVDLGSIEVETEVIEVDADGWITDWLDHFTQWEVMGATVTPFPAFAKARVALTSTPAVSASASPAAITAATPLPELSIPLTPPAAWFQVEEPAPGKPFELGSVGDEWLVEQNDQGSLAMPLQITADGLILGHVAYWGQCHVGYPGTCVVPPTSDGVYSKYMVGQVECDDGSFVSTGVLTAGCDHAISRLRAPEALSHYAHNGIGWGDVHVTNGVYGPWACGALRPDVTPEQVRVLRAGALSGDWRIVDGELRMIATLAVNTPGFPIAREALTAAALPWFGEVRPRARVVDGVTESLVAAGQVRRCAECAKRAAAAAVSGDVEGRLARLERQVNAQRSILRALTPAAIESLDRRVRRNS